MALSILKSVDAFENNNNYYYCHCDPFHQSVRIVIIYLLALFWPCRIVYRRYQDICESVRNSVINTFFDETFLQMYSKQKINQHIIRLNFEGHLQRILQSEMVDQLISTELHSLAMSPEGQLLSSAGINVVSLRPLVKPYIVDLLTDVIPDIMESFSSYSQVGWPWLFKGG